MRAKTPPLPLALIMCILNNCTVFFFTIQSLFFFHVYHGSQWFSDTQKVQFITIKPLLWNLWFSEWVWPKASLLNGGPLFCHRWAHFHSTAPSLLQLPWEWLYSLWLLLLGMLLFNLLSQPAPTHWLCYSSRASSLLCISSLALLHIYVMRKPTHWMHNSNTRSHWTRTSHVSFVQDVCSPRWRDVRALASETKRPVQNSRDSFSSNGMAYMSCASNVWVYPKRISRRLQSPKGLWEIEFLQDSRTSLPEASFSIPRTYGLCLRALNHILIFYTSILSLYVSPTHWVSVTDN